MVLREWIDVERDGTLRARMGRGGAAKAGGRVRGTPREVPSRNERGDLASRVSESEDAGGRARGSAGDAHLDGPVVQLRRRRRTRVRRRHRSARRRQGARFRTVVARSSSPGGVSDTRALAAIRRPAKKEGNHPAPPFWAPIWRGPGRRARRGEGARRVPRRVSSLESVAVRTAAEPSLESRSRVAVDAVLAGRHVVGARSTGDIRRRV